jgi:Predicted GTPases
MNKCHGCGIILQTNSVDEIGYTKIIDSQLCERCFRIKHYNDYKRVGKNNEDFMPIINEISKTSDLVILLIDLFNIPRSLKEMTEALDNDILLVLTKRDILPISLYEERLIEYFYNLSKKIVDTIIISSNNNYHIDELMEKIREYKTSKDVYVVGFTNAGKSTLINKVLYNYTDKMPVITTSILPSTTIEKIVIEINDELTLIDTPGLIESGSMLDLVEENILKRIVPKKEIKPITYQIRDWQNIYIDELVRLELENSNNITLYMSNDLEIERSFNSKKKLPNLEKRIIKVFDKEDIVIVGLGFIKVMKSDDIIIYTIPGVEIYTRKSFL